MAQTNCMTKRAKCIQCGNEFTARRLVNSKRWTRVCSRPDCNLPPAQPPTSPSPTEGGATGEPAAAGQAEPKIRFEGYSVELTEVGPWLKGNLTWTPIWDERGVWTEWADADLARARSRGLESSERPDIRDDGANPP